MVDRIRQLMEYKGLTSTQLADSIEVPRAVISHILSGRNNPSLDVVLKVLSCYRDVAPDWMLFGEGEMLIALASESKPVKAVPPAEILPPKAGAYIPEEPAPIRKVQEPSPAVKELLTDGRAIEQIMVFYTDKTFITYRPGV